MKNTLICIATHPDDETIGAAGTILKFKKQGFDIHWLIVTDMHTEAGFNQNQIEERENLINKVASIYGFKSIQRLKLPTCRLETIPLYQIVDDFKNIFEQLKPTHIILPHWNDAHSDHRITFDAALACLKKFRLPTIQEIWTMETLSETDQRYLHPAESFNPNIFVDITEHQKEKIEILSLYSKELKPHPFARSIEGIEALSKVRGATANCQNAESFQLIRSFR